MHIAWKSFDNRESHASVSRCHTLEGTRVIWAQASSADTPCQNPRRAGPLKYTKRKPFTTGVHSHDKATCCTVRADTRLVLDIQSATGNNICVTLSHPVILSHACVQPCTCASTKQNAVQTSQIAWSRRVLGCEPKDGRQTLQVSPSPCSCSCPNARPVRSGKRVHPRQSFPLSSSRTQKTIGEHESEKPQQTVKTWPRKGEWVRFLCTGSAFVKRKCLTSTSWRS